MDAPRITRRAVYDVRPCTDGGGRPHFHVTAFGRAVVIHADRFTFADRADAQREADRLNRLNGERHG